MSNCIIQYSPFPIDIALHPNKHIVNTTDQFQSMLQFLAQSPVLVFDFETSGLDWYRKARAIGIALAGWDSAGRIQCFYVPFRHMTLEPQLEPDKILPAIGGLLYDPRTIKIAHNFKFDAHIAANEGWEIRGDKYDTMIAAHLFDENRRIALKQRAIEDLGIKDADHWEKDITEKLIELAKLNRMKFGDYVAANGYSQLSIMHLGIYACFDVDLTLQLYLKYESEGISKKYSRIWNTEMKLLDAILSMERYGLPIDTNYLMLLRDSLEGVQAGLQDQIYHQIGTDKVNLGSDDDVRDLIINRLGLPLSKLTKGGKISVDKEALSAIALNPVAKLIMAWREAEQLSSTFTKSITDKLDASGILHPDFQQVGTYTGRLSCRNPNFQNQPVDDNDRAIANTGKSLKDGGIDPWSIRRAYIVRKGMVRLFFDYSQIELRVLAKFSQDPVMVNAFLRGEDIHTRTCKEVFGTDDPAWRRKAKIINFGLSYCMTEIGFSRQAGISVEDAQKYLETFFVRYRGVKAFRNNFWRSITESKGYFENLFGRPRRLTGMLGSTHDRVRAQRQAIASLIQGSAAELTKESMVRIDGLLKSEFSGAHIVATVHDEIQVDCYEECAEDVAREVKACMEDFSTEFDPIPIITDVAISNKTWADKKAYK